jgi:hypothetical protein
VGPRETHTGGGDDDYNKDESSWRVYVSSKLEMAVATLIVSRVQERPYKIWLRTRVDDGGQRRPVSSGHTMGRNKKGY